MFAVTVALGLWHGLLALPVFLSFFGPAPYDSAIERELTREDKWRPQVLQPLSPGDALEKGHGLMTPPTPTFMMPRLQINPLFDG